MRSSVLRFALIGLAVACLAMGTSAYAQYDEGGNDTSLPPGEPLLFPPQAPPPPPPQGCSDSDIQMLAAASVSNGGTGTYGPYHANNGILGPPPCNEPDGAYAWVAAPSCGGGPSGHWIMLEWDGPIEVCQIFVDTKPIEPDACGAAENRIASDAVVQYWNGASWVTAGSVSGRTDDWTFAFEGLVSTSRIRLMDLCVDPAPPGQDDNAVFYEIKVYDGTIPVELEKFEIDR